MMSALPPEASKKKPELVAMERHPWQPGLLIGFDLQIVPSHGTWDEPWTVDCSQYGVGREWNAIVRQLITTAFTGRTICVVGGCDDPPPFTGMSFHLALHGTAAVWIREKCPESILMDIAASMELELGWMAITTTVPLCDKKRFEAVLMSHLDLAKRERKDCEDEAFRLLADGDLVHWRNPSLPLDDIYAICRSAAKDVGLAFVVR